MIHSDSRRLSTSWAAMTTLYTNASAMLPEAYTGSTGSRQGSPAQFRDGGNLSANAVLEDAPGSGNMASNSALVNYLEANTQDVDYLVAVPSANQGESLVLATGRPVLY